MMILLRAFSLMAGLTLLSGPLFADEAAEVSAPQPAVDEQMQLQMKKMQEAIALQKRRSQLKQKLDMTVPMLTSSAAAKRVMASDHAEAKGHLQNAQTLLDQAKAAFEKDDFAVVDDAVKEAYRVFGLASRLVPDEQAAREQAKARYKELRDGLTHFVESLEEILAEKGKKGRVDIDPKHIRENMQKAESLAEEQRYQEANNLLSMDYEQASDALMKLREGDIVDYQPEFKTPADEFNYELKRVVGYIELVPIAIEQFKPAPEVIEQIQEQLRQGVELMGKAKAQARQDEHNAGLELLHAATEALQAGLRTAGLASP